MEIKFEDVAENRIIAFVDMLGFKEIFNKENSEQINNVIAILHEFKNIKLNYNASIESTNEPGVYSPRIDPDFHSVSDSIIISVPIHATGIPHFDQLPDAHFNTALGAVINVASHLQLSLLTFGITLRGAISYGKMYYNHEQSIFVGKPLIEAIEDESKMATYPRIIASKTLVDELKRLWKSKNSTDKLIKNFDFIYPPLRRDFDGIYFVDYLNDIFIRSSQPEIFDNLLKIRDQIDRNLAETKDKIKIFSKWCWLANYFDKKLKLTVNPDNPSFLPITNFNLSVQNIENLRKHIQGLGT